MPVNYHSISVSLPSKEWHNKATQFAREEMGLGFSRATVRLFENAMREAKRKADRQEIGDEISELRRLVGDLVKEVKAPKKE